MGLLEAFGGIYGAQSLEVLQISVVLDAQQATMGLKELRDGVLQGGQEFGKYALAAGEVIGPLIAIGVAMWETAASAAHFAHEIGDLNIITGLSVRYLQELKYACDANLISFDSVTTSVMFFQKHIGDLDSPTSNAAKGLARLGIDAKDANGEFREMDELFPEMIAALKEVKDPTERAGLSMELFGRSTKEIIKLIDLGTEGIDRFGVEAQKLGIIMGPAEQAKADEYAKELAKMNAEWEAMWRNVGVELIPVIKDLVPLMEEMMPYLKGLTDFAVLAAAGFKQLADAINLTFNAFLKIQTLGTGGDVTGAYNQLASDIEKGGELQKSIVSGGAPGTGATGTAISRSKQLYATKYNLPYGQRATVTQINNINAMQMSPEQLTATQKKMSSNLATQMSFEGG